MIEGHPACRLYMAVCGAEMTTAELPDALCADDCDRGSVYCPERLRVASEHNAETGVVVTASHSGSTVPVR
ncbi:MAG: hypothetical protein ACRDRO_19730 [Pseudonocardiaceae bacterium]